MALIKFNAETIITLDFERLLEFLKEGLFDRYIEDTSKLISDAQTISISKRKLDRWATEYLETLRLQSPDVLECEAVKKENRQLSEDVKMLERRIESLSGVNGEVLGRFLEEKEKNEAAKEQCEELKEQVKSLKSMLVLDRKAAQEQHEKEVSDLQLHGTQLSAINSMMEATVIELESKLMASRRMEKEGLNEREDLKVKLLRLSKMAIGQS